MNKLQEALKVLAISEPELLFATLQTFVEDSDQTQPDEKGNGKTDQIHSMTNGRQR